MTGSNTMNETLSAKVGEEGAAGLPGVVLGGPYGKAALVESEAIAFGELGNKAGVAVRGRAAELVIEVDDREGDAGGGGELAEKMEQTYRVRPAGDGDA